MCPACRIRRQHKTKSQDEKTLEKIDNFFWGRRTELNLSIREKKLAQATKRAHLGAHKKPARDQVVG
jgi:hypothetical protein